MIAQNINPVLVTVFGLDIRWYGIIYALGIVFALFFVLDKVRKGELKNLDIDRTYSLFIWLIIGDVIGARIFNVLFYNLSYYLASPLQIFNLRNGGLSFHGGLLGCIIVAFLFCRKYRINFLKLGDAVIIPAALALAFGRIANFINSELYGKVTTLPWGVIFPGVEGARHPTQIYESLKNFFLFFLLFAIDRRRNDKSRKKLRGILGIFNKDGSMLFSFMFLYGIIRFFIEFLKEFPVVFLGMTMGQLLCVATVIAAIAGFIFISKRKNGKRGGNRAKIRIKKG